jgi:hypothetical protein
LKRLILALQITILKTGVNGMMEAVETASQQSSA